MEKNNRRDELVLKIKELLNSENFSEEYASFFSLLRLLRAINPDDFYETLDSISFSYENLKIIVENSRFSNLANDLLFCYFIDIYANMILYEVYPDINKSSEKIEKLVKTIISKDEDRLSKSENPVIQIYNFKQRDIYEFEHRDKFYKEKTDIIFKVILDSENYGFYSLACFEFRRCRPRIYRDQLWNAMIKLDPARTICNYDNNESNHLYELVLNTKNMAYIKILMKKPNVFQFYCSHQLKLIILYKYLNNKDYIELFDLINSLQEISPSLSSDFQVLLSNIPFSLLNPEEKLMYQKTELLLQKSKGNDYVNKDLTDELMQIFPLHRKKYIIETNYNSNILQFTKYLIARKRCEGLNLEEYILNMFANSVLMGEALNAIDWSDYFYLENDSSFEGPLNNVISLLTISHSEYLPYLVDLIFNGTPIPQSVDKKYLEENFGMSATEIKRMYVREDELGEFLIIKLAKLGIVEVQYILEKKLNKQNS